MATVETTNYEASVVDHQVDEPEPEEDKMKARILWSIIVIMLIVCFLNTAVLLWILHSIKTDTVEINDTAVKIFGSGVFNTVEHGDGFFEAFDDEPMQIIGDDFFSMKVKDKFTDNEMKITPQKISFDGFRQFDLMIGNKRRDFMKSVMDNLQLPKDLQRLDVSQLHTSKIISPDNSSLTLKSGKFIQLRGNKGVHVKGKHVSVVADGEIYINSKDGSMYFMTSNFSMNITRLPIVPITSRPPTMLPTLQYKLCICMPVGSFFIVPILPNTRSQLACSYVDMSPEYHPCMLTAPKQLFSD